MIAAWAIAILVFIQDFKTRTISNNYSLTLALLGLVFQGLRVFSQLKDHALCAALLLDGAHISYPFLLWESALGRRLPSAAACVCSALLALVLISALELGLRAKRGVAGLGLGDVKYVSAWCVWLGPVAIFVLAIACLSGAVGAKLNKQPDFALGPWISLWALVASIVLLL